MSGVPVPPSTGAVSNGKIKFNDVRLFFNSTHFCYCVYNKHYITLHVSPGENDKHKRIILAFTKAGDYSAGGVA